MQFDSHLPLQKTAEFTLIRLPLLTGHPSICTPRTVPYFVPTLDQKPSQTVAEGRLRGQVTVSLTRTVLWLLSLGIFDKAYAQQTVGSTDEHASVAPDLFTAETPLGTYQGLTDQVVLSRTPGSFRTVLVPRGSSKPEWLGTR
jgi:hypothetical protein